MTLSPAPPLAVTTPPLLTSTQGVPFDYDFDATGGIGPYSWSLKSGTLPAGLTLDSEGEITGYPTTSGTFAFTVEATDSASPTPAVASLPVTITLGAAGPLVVTPTTLSPGQVGTTYGYSFAGYSGCYGTTLQASGGIGPYTWSVASGALPAGITLDSSGELCGTPTASGTFYFTAEATDSATPTPAAATASLSLVIAPATPFVITTTALPSAVQGVAYSAALGSTGGTAPITWSVSSGSLPPGLSLSAAGVITGVPATAGTYAFAVDAADQVVGQPQPAAVPLTLVVGNPLLKSAPSTLPTGHVGTPYSGTLAATGGIAPYHWKVIGGQLPDGLTLDGTSGVISGTPTTPGKAGQFNVEITDSSTSDPQTIDVPESIDVSTGALVFGTPSLPDATTGTPYEEPLFVSGGIAPYLWTVSSGSLPAGLSLDSNGEVVGTAETAGTSTFTVTASDSSSPTAESATEGVSITVDPVPDLATTTVIPPEGAAGELYYLQLGAIGGEAPYSWTILSGSLPTGLSLDAYGAITGVTTTAGTFQVSVGVTDFRGCSVDCGRVPGHQGHATLSADGQRSLLSSATVGDPYPATALTSSGGVAPVTWSIKSGSLPPGLTLDAASGMLSGTPTAGGTYSFTVAVSDAESPPSVSTDAASITVAPSPTSTAITATLQTAVGGQGDVLARDGQFACPARRHIGNSRITDRPFQAVRHSASIITTPTTTQTRSRALSLTPFPASTPLVRFIPGDTSTDPSTAPTIEISSVIYSLAVATTSVPVASAGTAYPDTYLSATGGISPYTWAVTSGALPPGMTLNANSGDLAGTPTSAGTFAFTVGVTDSEPIPVTVTQDLSLTVAQAPTTTNLGDSADTVVAGQSETYTATVNAALPPGGTVDFSGNSARSPPARTLRLTTSAPFTATCTVGYTTPGTHLIQASYSGDDSTTSSASATSTVTVTPALAVATTSVPAASAGTAYPDTYLSATGGISPYTWAVTSGALPPGMTLDANSGDLAGTPTSAGTFAFTVGVTDSEPIPVTVTQDLSLTVAPGADHDQSRRLRRHCRGRSVRDLHGNRQCRPTPGWHGRFLGQFGADRHLPGRCVDHVCAVHSDLHGRVHDTGYPLDPGQLFRRRLDDVLRVGHVHRHRDTRPRRGHHLGSRRERRDRLPGHLPECHGRDQPLHLGSHLRRPSAGDDSRRQFR